MDLRLSPQGPPNSWVISGKLPSVHVNPPSIDVVKFSVRAPPSRNRLSWYTPTILSSLNGLTSRSGSACDQGLAPAPGGRRSLLARSGGVIPGSTKAALSLNRKKSAGTTPGSGGMSVAGRLSPGYGSRYCLIHSERENGGDCRSCAATPRNPVDAASSNSIPAAVRRVCITRTSNVFSGPYARASILVCCPRNGLTLAGRGESVMGLVTLPRRTRYSQS